MLYISTTPNSAALLNVSRQLLQSLPPRIQVAVELSEMVQSEKSPLDTRIHVVNMLLGDNQTKQALESDPEFDATDYFQKAATAWLSKFLCNVIIRTDDLKEALHLFRMYTSWIDENAQTELRVTIASRLLSMKLVPKAAGLIAELDYKKCLLRLDSIQKKIQLIFLKDILSKEKQLDLTKTRGVLFEIIAIANKPIVEDALADYIRVLFGRMECSNETLADINAAQWIAEALWVEFQIFSLNQKHLKSLACWMVFAGRVTEIINIMGDIYKADPAISNNYTYLSIFLWKKGYYDEGLACFKRERLTDTVDPYVLFTRALSFSLFSTPEKTAYWLNKLYYIDNKFFTRPNLNTYWGFLVLILKKIGQSILSYKAQSMAKKYDPYNAMRQHLWSRIPSSLCMRKFPGFIMPDEFDSIDAEKKTFLT